MKNHPDAVKCPLCPEILLKKFLQDHIRLQHNQMSSVKNNVQPSIFEVLKNVKYSKPAEIRLSREEDKDPLSEPCGERNARLFELPQNCPDCNKTYANWKSLASHLRNVHKKKSVTDPTKTPEKVMALKQLKALNPASKNWTKVRGTNALQQAIKAIKEDGMNISQAAKMFGLSRSTLQRYINGNFKDKTYSSSGLDSVGTNSVSFFFNLRLKGNKNY